jgi:uncharacterized protein involved in type VI secretion and phage assembly
MAFTQDNRVIKIQIENLAPNDLLLTAVTGQEAISRPFSYRVEMLCEDLTREFNPADMIGASATIGVKLRKDSNEYRFRSGFIRSFQTGSSVPRSFPFLPSCSSQLTSGFSRTLPLSISCNRYLTTLA